MPKMLTMSNGKPETILSPRDFENLIDKHMGMDSANYYQEQIEALSDCIRDCLKEFDDTVDTDGYEEVLKEFGYE